MNSFHARKPKAKPATHERKPGPAQTAPQPHGDQLRADALLVQRGLASSRTAAQKLIAAGRVVHGLTPVAKASQLLATDAELRLLPGD